MQKFPTLNKVTLQKFSTLVLYVLFFEQELEKCLHQCGNLMAASTYSLFRLRGMLNKSNKRLRRSVQAVYDKQEVIHQLQEQAKVLSRKADQVEGLTSDLSVTKTSLAAKSGELTEVQEKLNENYRLVAKLSSENLKLSGEKVKADQLVAQVIQEQVLLPDQSV